jgi:23S rRNA (cytidine2498-2'-O)-methyltransferase
MSQLVCTCRAGLEADLREEVLARLEELGWRAGDVAAEAGSGYLTVALPAHTGGVEALGRLTARWPVFARQVFIAGVALPAMAAGDRVSAIVEAAAALGPCSDVWVETTDAEPTRPLLPLCRALAGPLQEALRRRQLLRADATLPRLHVFLHGSTKALVGRAMAAHTARWPMGIPRLKMPREAPSRSVLKLDEALAVFLENDERSRLLRPGQRAVDLGAAPGGWSWLLAQHGLQVIAVDNGRLAPQVLRSGLIEHRREDGFSFRPRKPVDWMVCDIVEQPRRVAERMAQWFAQRWCRQAIFNLKLPMKKRYAAVMQAHATIAAAIADRPSRLAFRQLYHDREEVTGFYRELPPG